MTSASSFEPISSLALPALRTVVQGYRHPSGAIHYHFANDDQHRSFCVGFRTSPEDSSGLPHILEHTALCGSRRYPVRDPFFMMLRRSLQTFMNAMTYPDRTCYPFATQNLQDFHHLLGIYLDASFAPLLDPLDFAQEGWRLAPTADSQWAIKGVVYNEMKGAMADADSQVWDALGRALLPDTCYRHNSGGDPQVIPTLQHYDLVAFHRRTYCAANACFTTWGDLDVAQLHDAFSRYCEDFPGSAVALPELQAPLTSEQHLRIPVPLSSGQDPRDATIAGITWVWGDSADLDQVLIGELADQLLLGHAAAPLRLCLEGSQLGRSASGSGYQAYLRNGAFSAELQGMALADQDKLPGLVMDCLEEVAKRGFEPAELASALHQLELRRRRIGGDGMPFGLVQCLRATGTWCSGGDVCAALDQDSALKRLKEHAGNPDFWPSFIQSHFLNHQHRACYQTLPDSTWANRAEQQEAALVDQHLAKLDDHAKAERAALDQRLNERQNQANDPGCLPELALSDVPRQRPFSDGPWISDGLRFFQAATGGLLTCYAAFPLAGLDDDDLDYLSTAIGVVGRLGFGKHDYQQTARLLDACCAGISTQAEWSPDGHQLSVVRGFLLCSISGLSERASEWLPLLPQVLRQQRFDETGRLHELLLASLSHLNDALLQAGHSLAASAAQRSFAGHAGMLDRLNGLGRRDRLKQLLKSCEDNPQALADYAKACQLVLNKLVSQTPALALVSDQDQAGPWQTLLEAAWGGDSPKIAEFTTLAQREMAASTNATINTAYTTATPVSFNALALPTVGMDHPDAAALAVACRFLTHELLHRQIREQGGAYGASASWQGSSGSVVLTSYRDPRLSATYDDLAAGLRWLHDCAVSEQALKEAKLSLMAAVDSPLSPTGEARRRFMNDLHGHSPERFNAFRQAILAVEAADIHRAARTHLDPQRGCKASITSDDCLNRDRVDWPKVLL